MNRFKPQSLTVRFGLEAVFQIGGGENRALASENVTVIVGFEATTQIVRYPSMMSNASCQRTTRPVEGDGKCAVHIKVDVSQKRPNNSRLDLPACAES